MNKAFAKYRHYFILVIRVRALLLILLLLTLHIELKAQTCDENLEQARRFYQIGQIEKVPGVLESCMEKGFTKAQKTEAYELLVLTYQFDNEPKEAEETFISLLKHDPEYAVNEANTPAEMMRLYNTYHAPPVYSIGFIGGVNLAFGQRTQSFGLSNAEKNLTEYSSDGFGFQAGLTVKRYISKSFELNLDLMYNNVRYERILSQLGFSEVLYQEDQRQFIFPLTFTYDIDFGRFSPYVRLGGGLAYMFSSEATIERIYNENSITNLPNVSGPAIDMIEQRNNINFFSTVGAGLKFKVPRGIIALDVRHNWNFLQQNRPSKRYDNNILVYEYLYVDDDFKLGNIAVSLGYTYSFHKIKLLKNKKETNGDK
jgi:hypothetical protein